MKKKPKRIKFAPSIAIEGLRVYVDEVLDAISEVCGLKYARDAFVSDESTISNFLESSPTGEKSKHPFDDSVECEVVTSDTPANRKLVEEISQRLGVKVEIYDYVYEVAVRLRDK